MRIALGLKAHSGWAALVAVGVTTGEPCVVDRRRIALVEEADASWAKAPYHAAEGLDPAEARDVVKRGIAGAQRSALREMRAALARARAAEHEVAACAVLVSGPMPAWSVGEILAVHFRMHKAEGVLFPEALLRAAEACEVRAVAVPERQLGEHATKALAGPLASVTERIAALGRSVGPPWGKDQKNATLAALIALGPRRA